MLSYTNYLHVLFSNIFKHLTCLLIIKYTMSKALRYTNSGANLGL